MEFAGFDDLMAFMRQGPGAEVQVEHQALKTEPRLQERSVKWLADESNREVGPVEWERIRVNDNVSSALEPTIVEPIA